MKSSSLGLWTICVGTVAAVLSAPSLVVADGKAPANAKQVELFAAIKAGDIAVKLIPKDVNEANLLIENKANRPLTIKLPEAFAGVLAQPGMGIGGGVGGLGGGGRGVGGGMGGGMQGFGGGFGGMGMGGMGMGGMGMGGMGGFFNVAPDKVGKIKVPIVCLEHGKHDPTPRAAYEIRPIESFTDNQKVIEVCKMLGHGEITRNAAQAAVWHLASGLTWAELAYKDKIRLSNGYTEKYFSSQEIAMAMRVAVEAVRRAEKEEKDDPAKRDSLSQR